MRAKDQKIENNLIWESYVKEETVEEVVTETMDSYAMHSCRRRVYADVFARFDPGSERERIRGAFDKQIKTWSKDVGVGTRPHPEDCIWSWHGPDSPWRDPLSDTEEEVFYKENTGYNDDNPYY